MTLNAYNRRHSSWPNCHCAHRQSSTLCKSITSWLAAPVTWKVSLPSKPRLLRRRSLHMQVAPAHRLVPGAPLGRLKMGDPTGGVARQARRLAAPTFKAPRVACETEAGRPCWPCTLGLRRACRAPHDVPPLSAQPLSTLFWVRAMCCGVLRAGGDEMSYMPSGACFRDRCDRCDRFVEASSSSYVGCRMCVGG